MLLLIYSSFGDHLKQERDRDASFEAGEASNHACKLVFVLLTV